MPLTLRDFGIGFVVFASVLTGMLGFIGGFAGQYPSANFDNGTLESLSSDASAESNQFVTQTRNRSGSFQEGRSLLDLGGFFINTVYQILTLPLDAMTAVDGMASIVLGELGVESPWLINMVVGVLFIIIGYEIVSVYRGVRT